MKRPVWLVLSLLLACPLRADIAAEHAEFFEKKIRPLLVEHCYECHDSRRARGDLQLTSRSSLLRGGKSGQPAIVAGDPAASRLIYAVLRKDPEFKMPPDDEHALSEEQVEDLEQWIGAGAPWPQVAHPHRDGDPLPGTGHWAFQSPRFPEPPHVRSKDWPSNDIDRFILARLEQQGLSPPPTADRHTLIRRAKLDLLGLPPTPD